MRRKKLQKSVIDKHYGELYNKKLISKNPEFSASYEEQLKIVDKFFENSDPLNKEFDINFISIVEKAEIIKTEKHFNRELIYFMIFGTSLLLCFAAFTFSLGIKFLVISQAFISLTAVFTLLFCANKSRQKGDGI